MGRLGLSAVGPPGSSAHSRLRGWRRCSPDTHKSQPRGRPSAFLPGQRARGAVAADCCGALDAQSFPA